MSRRYKCLRYTSKGSREEIVNAEAVVFDYIHRGEYPSDRVSLETKIERLTQLFVGLVDHLDVDVTELIPSYITLSGRYSVTDESD